MLSYCQRKGKTQAFPVPGPCTTRQGPAGVGEVGGEVLVLGMVLVVTGVLELTVSKTNQRNTYIK